MRRLYDGFSILPPNIMSYGWLPLDGGLYGILLYLEFFKTELSSPSDQMKHIVTNTR